MYKSLGEQVDERYKETSQDHESWTSVYNNLQKHIGFLTNAFSQYEKEQNTNIQTQIEQQIAENNQLKQEIAALKDKLNEMTARNNNLNDFLNEMEALNTEQQEIWNKSNRKSKTEIQRILAMIEDLPQVWFISTNICFVRTFKYQSDNRDDEVLIIKNDIERIKSEQTANENRIKSLQSALDKQQQVNAGTS